MNDAKICETLVQATVNFFRANKKTEPEIVEQVVDLILTIEKKNDFKKLRKLISEVWLFDDDRVLKWEKSQVLLLSFDSLSDARVGRELVRIARQIDKKGFYPN